MRYYKFTEEELKKEWDTIYVESAVEHMLDEGYTLVSVSYVGGCRTSGYHVYHFVK